MCLTVIAVPVLVRYISCGGASAAGGFPDRGDWRWASSPPFSWTGWRAYPTRESLYLIESQTAKNHPLHPLQNPLPKIILRFVKVHLRLIARLQKSKIDKKLI